MGDFEDDRAEIIALIHANRIAIWTHDFEGWQNCFVHEPYTTRLGYWRGGGIFFRQGWELLSERVRRHMLQELPYSLGNAHDTKVVNLELRIGSDMAWATFDQLYPGYDQPDHVGAGLSREWRIFERHGGRWRIAMVGFLDTSPARPGMQLLRLSAEGRVVWAGEEARARLAQDEDLVIRNGRLRVRDSQTDQKLQAAIRWASGMDDGYMSAHGALPIVHQAGEGMPTRIWWVIADAGMILFSIGEHQMAEERLRMAAIIYGLSAAQTRLAGLVATGMTLPEIAKAMDVSPNTARTHLHRVFEKTGVHNQAALVRVLLSAASPV